MNIRIQTIHFDADTKLTDFLEKRAWKLHTFYDRIHEFDAYLKLDNGSGQVREKVVELKVSVPGSTLFAAAHDLTFEKAVDEAVESIRRQLKKHKEKVKK